MLVGGLGWKVVLCRSPAIMIHDVRGSLWREEMENQKMRQHLADQITKVFCILAIDGNLLTMITIIGLLLRFNRHHR